MTHMAQKLVPAEKNSTDISAASAAFCISDEIFLCSLAILHFLDNPPEVFHCKSSHSPPPPPRSTPVNIIINIVNIYILLSY